VKRPVVLVVDVQNDYCHEDGALGRSGQLPPDVDATVDAIDRLLGAARAAKVPVVHLRMVSSPWFTDVAWSRRGIGSAVAADAPAIAARGTWGAEPYRVLPHPDDLVLEKYRHSGFICTPLSLVLRALQCGTVVLAGFSADVCVEATARDAVSHGFEIVVVPECIGGTSADAGAASMHTMTRYLGRASTLGQLADDWAHTTGH
jgi:ureidoacrylate peracid hydrolase